MFKNLSIYSSAVQQVYIFCPYPLQRGNVDTLKIWEWVQFINCHTIFNIYVFLYILNGINNIRGENKLLSLAQFLENTSIVRVCISTWVCLREREIKSEMLKVEISVKKRGKHCGQQNIQTRKSKMRFARDRLLPFLCQLFIASSHFLQK